MNTSSKSNFPRANGEITSANVRLIDADGSMLGVVPLRKALQLAAEKNLDLVEIASNADHPVCKIQDYGKFKYELKKKAHDLRKKQKIVETKEIKLRPNIGQGDYEVKLRSIQKFIGEGNKVKITLRFRGREITHHDIGLKLLEKLQADTLEICKTEFAPRMEGKQLMMILAPK